MADRGTAPNEEKNAAAAAHAPVAQEPSGRSGHDDAHGQGAVGHGHDGEGHGDHDPTDVALGPMDRPAWIAGALGVAAGLIVIAAMYIAGKA